MWIVVHKGTGVVVSSSQTRAQSYADLKSLTGITDERYRVECV